MNVEQVSESIELAIKECGVTAIAKLPAFTQAIKMAQGIARLREAFTDEFVDTTLMPLCGSPLGFLTDLDNDKEGRRYPPVVVRDCCIEAMLRGFNVVGNEFNIIAKRFYGAKAGYERLVSEYPGFSNLELHPGVPHQINNNGALVPFTATWLVKGTAMRIDCQLDKEGDGGVRDRRIPVRVNAGMGTDAILGKATRKIFYRIHQRLHGSAFATEEDEPIPTTGETVPSSSPAPSPVPAGSPEGRRIRLGGKRQREAAKASSAPSADDDVPISRAPVNVAELHDALATLDDRWKFDAGADVIRGWTEEQRREALAWARVVLSDGDFREQSARPEFTVLPRMAGEEG